MMKRRAFKGVLVLSTALVVANCGSGSQPPAADAVLDTVDAVPPRLIHEVGRDVTAGEYFSFVDSLVAQYDPRTPYVLEPYVLAHANPWVIDSLASTDYEVQTSRGVTVSDPKELVVLRTGDILELPRPAEAQAIRERLDRITIDVNIPEFTVRILHGDSVLFAFPARVGQNRSRHLAMAGRTVDLRTQTGVGTIVRIEDNPRFVNPVDNHEYTATTRDDGVVTALPRIPFLEPELDGIRYGQLIHPTTNPETLGRASSNGCIGVSEYAAWILYFHAPVGTRVVVRYDLDGTVDDQPVTFPDVYNRRTPEIPDTEGPPSGEPNGGCLPS